MHQIQWIYFALFLSGVPQRLDAGDLGRPTRYCYLESIYHAWDGGTDHRVEGNLYTCMTPEIKSISENDFGQQALKVIWKVAEVGFLN